MVISYRNAMIQTFRLGCWYIEISDYQEFFRLIIQLRAIRPVITELTLLFIVRTTISGIDPNN